MRSANEGIDRNVPFYDAKTKDEQISERLMNALLPGSALLALKRDDRARFTQTG